MPNVVIERLTPIAMEGDVLLDTPATAKAVVSAREELKVSQKALAIEMKVSQAYLCDLENGKRRWSLSLFNNAKSALGRLVE